MENDTLFIPTLNKQGFAAVTLDPFSKKFTEYEKGEYLEIGAAFGHATLKALENGASVTANDMDKRHLLYIKKMAAIKGLDTLQTVEGRFPDDLLFPEGFFSKILISRVLHFYSGKQIIKALQTTRKWLKTGGKLYVICETPYLENWKNFLPEYENRKKQDVNFPGEITNPKFWENNRVSNLPEFVHWIDKEVMENILIESGFVIDELAYIDRKDQFPEDLLFDGRESIGVIGRKI